MSDVTEIYLFREGETQGPYDQAAIDRMQDKGGHLVFIGSLAAEAKGPSTSVYAGIKAGVETYAKTLRKELIDKNIRVSVVEPGLVGHQRRRQLAEVEPVLLVERKGAQLDHRGKLLDDHAFATHPRANSRRRRSPVAGGCRGTRPHGAGQATGLVSTTRSSIQTSSGASMSWKLQAPT